jgi:hypothetical protein
MDSLQTTFTYLLMFWLIALSWSASFAQALHDRSLQEQAPESPTSFRTSGDLQRQSKDEIFSLSPGLRLSSYGASSQTQTLSVRGSDPAELGVSLEGIRLNSAARGSANLGEIETFGLDRLDLVRGGHPFFQASPGGQLQISLPRQAQLKTRWEMGSYGHLFIGHLHPQGSLSYRQDLGDYPYRFQNEDLDRENNGSRLLTARLWNLSSESTSWLQASFSSQGLAGPSSFPSLQDKMQVYSAMASHQQRLKEVHLTVWTQAHQQETFSQGKTSQTLSLYSGARLEKSHRALTDSILQHRVEVSSDSLFNRSFEDARRWTLSYSSSMLLDLGSGQILNPRYRVEFLSDLEDSWSIHPGFGGRHEIASVIPLRILWNASWISRAPTFFEMYFQDPFFRPNPRLKRQESLLADLGAEWTDDHLNLSSVFFVSRSQHLIETSVKSPTLSTVENLGSTLTWGLENQGQWRLAQALDIQMSYTYQQSRRGKLDRLYQPRHRLGVKTNYALTRFVSWQSFLDTRSRVRVPDFYSNPWIDSQWNLGLGALLQKDKNSFSIRLENLLAWEREEIKDYPLGNAPTLRLSFERNW